MKRGRWVRATMPAALCVLFLPAAGHSQKYERNITNRLLLGTVVYAGNDQPAEQANVELSSASGTPVAATVTGWGGEFYFDALTPGEYVVSVDKPGCESLWEKVQVPLEGPRVTLRLKKGRAAGDAMVSMRELSIPPRAQMALRNGIELLRSDLPQAMGSVQRAISLFPGYYEAYHVAGMADLMMDRPAEAEQAFRQSIELSGHRYVRPLMALGAVLCDRGEFAEAEALIHEALELDDTPWIGRLLLARALYGLGRWDEAEENADAAIVRRPEVADAYLLLAHIHVRQNDADAAIDDLDQFLKLEPEGEVSVQARRVREQLCQRDPSRQESSEVTEDR